MPDELDTVDSANEMHANTLPRAERGRLLVSVLDLAYFGDSTC
jgi:hypothetical protein